MAGDPYKYFRVEARELLEGLKRETLALERAPAGREGVGRILRLAHTLKGAARVVRLPDVGDLAHAVEDALAPHRDSEGAVPSETVTSVLRLLEAMAARLTALAAGGEPPGAAPPGGAAPEPLSSVRIRTEDYEALLRSVTSAAGLRAASRSDVGRLEAARAGARDLAGRLTGRNRETAERLADGLAALEEGLTERLDRLGGELSRAKDAVEKLGLTEAESLFVALEEAVRDAARTLSKSVQFRGRGGEQRLDSYVLSAVREALLHVVRNAVAHGVEPDAERRAAGKAVPAVVELLVERRGGRVAFVCRDDGRGVDVEAVRRSAVRKGHVPAAEADALSREAVVELLLKGGVSTSPTVTTLAGRGVGLESVREVATRLRGRLSLRTEPGKGTTFEIEVPGSMASVPSLRVEAGGRVACLPADAILQCLRVEKGNLLRSGDGESLAWNGKAVPFARLDRVLKRDGSAGRPDAGTAVVIGSLDRPAAIGVERLVGMADVVVRPLSDWAQVEPVVAGMTLDAEGRPEPVLDAAVLVEAARGIRSVPEPSRSAPSPILVIDDSLTTRMLEESILQSAGYAVELAASAEEGLGKAREKAYGLFIVDVEMPGMDGFEFVRLTRADPGLSKVPAILVTSRNAPEDLRRGKDVGAHAYMVKSEFDQGRLLATVRSLLG